MNFVKRFLLFLGTWLVLYMGSFFVAGIIVGGIAGSHTHDGISGMQAGALAGAEFGIRYRPIFFAVTLMLAALFASNFSPLAILAALPFAAGGFWVLDHLRPKPEDVLRAIPLAVPRATPAPMDVAGARQRAVTLYPQLGVANSRLNLEFRRRYESYQKTAPTYFDDPDWPSKLAKESKDALGKS